MPYPIADVSNAANLSLGFAFVLGLLHALEPGHGKSALFLHAAGGARHRLLPLVMGGAMAVSHTASLLVVAFVVHLATHVATGDHQHEDVFLRWLQLLSSTLIIAIGCWVIVSGLRRREPTCRCCRPVADDAATLPEAAATTGGATQTGATQTGATQTGAAATVDDSPASDAAPRSTTADDADDARSGHADLRLTALLGAAVGLLPCPSALAAYFASLSQGHPSQAYGSVVAFGVGIAISLALLGFALQRLGLSLQERSHRLASPRLWAIARGCLFIAIGLVYLAHGVPDGAPTHMH